MIDDSLAEKLVLSYGHEHRWQYGSDLVFTYGPLGFLTSRHFLPHAAGVRMLVDVLLAWGVAAGICLVAWRLSRVWKWLLLAVFLLVAANVDPRADLLIYMGLLAFALLSLVESGPRLALAISGFVALSVFGILVKGNFLVAAGFTAATLAVDLWGRGCRLASAWLAASLVGGYLFGWAALGQSLSLLWPVFKQTAAIVRDYNSTVGLEWLAAFRWRAMLTAGCLAAAVGLRSLGADLPRWRRGVLFAWLAGLVFLIWKHGFVRADLYHMGFFFGFAPVLVLALPLVRMRPETLVRRWERGFALAAAVVALLTLGTFFVAGFGAALVQPFRAWPVNVATVLHPGPYEQERLRSLADARRQVDLPRLRELVGDQTVDAYASDQCAAILPGFNYRPRPVFQSYMAYNDFLMRVNEDFYLAHPPAFLLFHLSPADRKLPPLEDARLLRHLLINYEPVAAEGLYLLLKCRSQTPARLTLLREGQARLGERISLAAFGETNLWLQLDLQASWLGKLRSFLYKPCRARLAAWRSSGPKDLLARGGAPEPMLAAGFLASPLLLRDEDVADLYAGRPVNRPAAYSIEPAPGTESLWKETVRYRLYRIENPLCTSASLLP
jgi:hypothetical protein